MGESYGLIVYQDDLLSSAIELAGYNWEEVDKFRYAVGKKIPKEMVAQYEKFTKGIIANGQTPEFAEKLWKLLNRFRHTDSTKRMRLLMAGSPIRQRT